MFKKSLIAVAVLGATAFSVQAADVTMYGKVDTGLLFKSNEITEGSQAKVDSDTFSMENGLNSASRFGVKGTEDLGNGVKVGFKLENGFKSDSGEFKTSGKLFDRESSVSVYSDFGTLSMGRMGGVGSAAGTYDIVYSTADAFNGGANSIFGFATSSRYDNMITYQTPKFAGLQVTAQYSFKEASGDEGREGSSEVNRYASTALTGNFGALNTVLAYEFQNYDSVGTNGREEDGHVVYLGGNFDCGFAKTFLMGQYFKGLKAGSVNALGMLDSIDLDKDNTYLDKANSLYDEGMKGYGLHLGTVVPISNGDLTVGAYYVDGTGETSKANVEERDFDYMGLAAKYEYRLSKRTSVYLGAGFHKATVDATAKANNEIEQKVGEVYTGLTHAF